MGTGEQKRRLRAKMGEDRVTDKMKRMEMAVDERGV
jgi:hypothetical protein